MKKKNYAKQKKGTLYYGIFIRNLFILLCDDFFKEEKKRNTQLGRKCLFGGYFPHVLKFKNHQVFLSVYDETFR